MRSHEKRSGLRVIAGLLIGAIALPAAAQPMLEIWNAASCSVTTDATFSVDSPIRLDRVDLWYNWRANETSAPYTILLDNEAVFIGALVRAECDPVQRAWCVARAEPRAILPPGDYAVRTQRAAICQNAGSQGQGFLRLYGSLVEVVPPQLPEPQPLNPTER